MTVETFGDIWRGPNDEGNFAGVFNIGNNGFGSLFVADGGRVFIPDAPFKGQELGPVLISIGGNLNGNGSVLLTDEGSGIDLINSPNNFETLGLWVGRREGSGLLEVINGADILVAQEAESNTIVGVGTDLGSVGELRLDNGRLDVSAADFFALRVGWGQGRGEAHFDNGSRIDVTNQSTQVLDVGVNGGIGTLTLAGQSQYTSRVEDSDANNFMIVGGQGGDGTVLLDDARLSLVTEDGGFAGTIVGAADGTGRMALSGGAEAIFYGSAGSALLVGRNPGSNGTVEVLSGATIDLGGNGYLALGVLQGTPATSTGHLIVAGEDSRVIGLEDAEIGRLGGVGTLELIEGGSITVSGGLWGGMADGSEGTARIIINDGTLEAGSITLWGGLVAGTGRLEAVGSGEGFATFRNTDLFIGDRQNDADALIADIGTLTVSGDLAKTDGRAIFDIAEAGTDQLLVDGALSFTGTTIVLNIANEGALSDGAIRLAQAEDGITLDGVSVNLTGLDGSVETELRENGTELWVNVSDPASQQLETLTFEQARDAFQVERLGPNQVVVTDAAGNSVEHADIGRIDFEDGSLLFDIDSANLGFTYRIYAAAYGRTPDEGGLRFWVDTMDFLTSNEPERDSFDFLAREFLTAPEFLALYGDDPSDMDYVDAMYQNVLGRLPDQEGYDFWVGAMEDGLDRADILIEFAESPENQEQTAPDLNDGIWVV